MDERTARIAAYNRHWQSVKAELGDIKISCRKLAIRHCAAPLVERRDMRLPLAIERFSLAASLEHQTTRGPLASRDEFLRTGIESAETSTLPCDDYCPVARSWYGSLLEAEEAMNNWQNNDYTGATIDQLQRLLHAAKDSYSAANAMHDEVTRNTPSICLPRDEYGMIQAWNGMKDILATGKSLQDAINAAAAAHNDWASSKTAFRKSRRYQHWYAYEIPIPALPPFVPPPQDQQPQDNFYRGQRSYQPQPNTQPKTEPEDPHYEWYAQYNPNSRYKKHTPGQTNNDSDKDAARRAAAGSNQQQGQYYQRSHEQQHSQDSRAGQQGYRGEHQRNFRAEQQTGGQRGYQQYGAQNTNEQYRNDQPRSSQFGQDNFGSGHWRNRYWRNHNYPQQQPRLREPYGQYSEPYYNDPYQQRRGCHHSGGRYERFGNRSWTPNTNAGKDALNGYQEKPAAPSARTVRAPADLLKDYNERWGKLQPHEAGFPYPSSTLASAGLLLGNIPGVSWQSVCHWSEELKVKVNAGLFFVKAFDLPRQVTVNRTTGKLSISLGADSTKLGDLRKQLQTRERRRWHPDQMNRRTGNEDGGIDEAISQKTDMKGIWAAVEELSDLCNEALGRTKGQRTLDA